MGYCCKQKLGSPPGETIAGCVTLEFLFINQPTPVVEDMEVLGEPGSKLPTEIYGMSLPTADGGENLGSMGELVLLAAPIFDPA